MVTIIQDKEAELKSLCSRFGVQRLELFGSAAVGEFDSQKSDLDFLVLFRPMTPGEHADAYFGLLEALQDLFERNIDLVEIGAIRNPYFRESVEETRQLIYAA